jgi:hypothetical protein
MSVIISETVIIYYQLIYEVDDHIVYDVRHHDSVNRYGIYVSQMTTDMFLLS